MLCNEVIEDKLTSNKTLVSIFNHIHTTVLPGIHPRMFIMVSLVDGSGEWKLAVLFRAPSGKEIMRLEGPVTFEDPGSVFDVVLELRNVPLLEIGKHHVDILASGSLIGERSFDVSMITIGGPNATDSK